MAGLSAKLTSLVQAAHDPALLAYAVINLGNGLPPPGSYDEKGFLSRVARIRSQLLQDHANFGRPMTRQRRLQQDLQDFAQLARLWQQVLHRQQQEEVMLAVQERDLAQNLFQRSTLDLFVRKLPEDSLPVMRQKLRADSPLLRLVVVSVIGRRRLHLETELIERLGDPHPAVRAAAREALIRVARGTDLGPLPGSPAGVARLAERWRQWLALQESASRETVAQAGGGKAVQFDPARAIQAIIGRAALHTDGDETARLADELVKARGTRIDEVLSRLRETKGVVHTDALALAIPRLPDDVRDRARDALAERLTRMKAKTLRDKFDDEDAEVRRAAARACALKGSKEHVPDLIGLLADPEPEVADAAHQALRQLTGKDFGPDPDATPGMRRRAIANWKRWAKDRPAKTN